MLLEVLFDNFRIVMKCVVDGSRGSSQGFLTPSDDVDASNTVTVRPKGEAPKLGRATLQRTRLVQKNGRSDRAPGLAPVPE
jgi:hypothetical protein